MLMLYDEVQVLLFYYYFFSFEEDSYLYSSQKSFFLTMQLFFFDLGFPGISLCSSLKKIIMALCLTGISFIIIQTDANNATQPPFKASRTTGLIRESTLCLSAAALSSRSFFSVGWALRPSSHHLTASEKLRSSIQH